MAIRVSRRVLMGMSALAISMPAVGEAAVTIWGPATTISDDTDISTAGTLVHAVNLGSESSATVNGVTFSSFPVPFNSSPITVGNITVRETMGPMSSYAYGQGNTAPYTSLSAPYQALLNDFVASGLIEAIEVTISGLTIGQEYQVQVWSNLSAAGSSDTNPNIVTLDGGAQNMQSNTTDTAGGLGQYALGTFTADSATLIFTVSALSGNVSVGPYSRAWPALNAFQVRAVPEPSSMALLALSALPLRRRRKC